MAAHNLQPTNRNLRVPDASHLPCPACGQPSDLPLEVLVERPRLECRCGFSTQLPVQQLRELMERIDKSKHLIRISSE